MISDFLPTSEGFSAKVYNFLKWITLIFLPAFATFYFALSTPFELPNAEGVLAACAALATFLGALLGISNANYKSSGAAYDGQVVVEQDPNDGHPVVALEYNGDPAEALTKDVLTFKVQNPDPQDPETFWEHRP